MPSSRKPTGPRRQKRSSRLRIVLLSIVSSIVLVMIGVMIFVVVAAAGTPKWDPAQLADQKQNSTLLDMNNAPFSQLHKSENRQILPSSEIPDLVKKTFVAVEDKRFYDHIGVDPIRIIGSALNDIRSRSTKEGASTITIQLARNAFIADPTAKTLTRKIQEAIIAIQLEHEYTKDEILTFYLNKIFLGQSSFGIQAAANTYFGVGVEDLKPDQIALLAGLPQAPTQYNPYINPDDAKNRRTIVLGVMRDAGLISSTEYANDKDAPFSYVETMKKTVSGTQKASSDTSSKFPSFVSRVIDELETTYNLTEDQIYSGGLQIYTTVDPKIQKTAEAAFADPTNFPKGIDKTKVEGAMTVIEPSTGAVRAMIGGRDYTTGGWNRAWQTKRQPGSTIKPLVVYGPAIEKGGYFPGTVLDDMPVSFNQGTGKPWEPTDFDTEDKGWKGLITMRYALEDSVNVYAVKLLNLIGVDYGWKFGKDNLGLPLEQKDRVLSLALGTPLVSTQDMASAYGVYANNGISVTDHTIVKVLDAKGNTLLTPKITKNRVMKETTAYIINDMLRSVVTNGTAVSAQIGNWAVAGKTGTTSLDPAKYGYKSGNPDAWFAGYTPNYAGVVWMGYDSDPDGQHYLRSVYGGSFTAKIWKKVMTVALQGLPVQSKFAQPEGIVSGSFDTKSGLLPSSLTPPQFIATEIAAQGDLPTHYSNVWFQKDVAAGGITKTFLNLPGRDPSWQWPSDEAPYKPPTENTSDTTQEPGSVPDSTTQDPQSGSSQGSSSQGSSSQGSSSQGSSSQGSSSQGDSSPSAPVLGQIVYDAKTSKAVIPMTVPSGNEKNSTIFYLQRPDQSAIRHFAIKASNTGSTSITISLTENGKVPGPGDYIFWAAFQDPKGSGVGPLSNKVKLTISD